MDVSVRSINKRRSCSALRPPLPTAVDREDRIAARMHVVATVEGGPCAERMSQQSNRACEVVLR